MTTPTRSIGLGTAQLAVLRTIAEGRVTEMDVRLALKQYVSGTAAAVLMQRLKGAGLIGWHRRGGRYYLTAKGSAQLPAVQQAAAMRPYVAPTQPPRRAGSMGFAELPSIAAGAARDWRHPC